MSSSFLLLFQGLIQFMSRVGMLGFLHLENLAIPGDKFGLWIDLLCLTHVQFRLLIIVVFYIDSRKVDMQDGGIRISRYSLLNRFDGIQGTIVLIIQLTERIIIVYGIWF